MSNTSRRARPLALSLALALSGCGEPEPAAVDPPATTASAADGGSQPATGATGATGGTEDATGTADVPDSGDTGDTEDATGTAGVPDSGDSGGTEDATDTADTPDRAGTGGAGEANATLVDCASVLPCRFESADGALAVTLSAADGESLDGGGPLRVDFAVETLSRDATIGITRRTSAIAGGQVLTPDTLRLGDVAAADARDEAAFDLLAGVAVNGHALFSDTLVGNPPTLDRLTLALHEAGEARMVAFADVPLGAEPSVPVDCAGALPCRWRSADGTVALALTQATALRWNRATRLVVSWRLGATRALELVTYPAGRVSDAEGVALEIYGVELAGSISSDGTPLEHPLGADDTLDGRLVLRRAPAEGSTRLARVEPGIAERRALRAPRWRPVFLNVPIAP